MNHPLPDAAANSYSWRQSYSNKVAAVTLQSTCTLPQWREPTALNGSELTPREKPAAAFQFRGAGHTGLLHGVLRAAWDVQMTEDNEGEGTGAQGLVWGLHGCGVTRAAGRDRKRSKQGMAYMKQHFIISK